MQTASITTDVQNVLSLMRPAIQADGGDVELVEVAADGTVLVRFRGACVGCPESSATLHGLLERQLTAKVPGVTGVRAVE